MTVPSQGRLVGIAKQERYEIWMRQALRGMGGGGGLPRASDVEDLMLCEALRSESAVGALLGVSSS